MKQFQYEDIIVDVEEGTFYPTETSKLIIEYVRKQDDFKQASLLDLGCGCGIVSLALKKSGFEGAVYGSDISETAAANARANFSRYGIEAEIKAGSIFEPWAGSTFDLILDDVSGISAPIAKISPWFGTSISCESGSDGTELTRQVIKEAPTYLNKGGSFFFPVLTLSNYPRILEEAESVFEKVELVNQQTFQFPPDLAAKHKDVLEKAIESKDIIVDYKFGLYIWETRIYKAQNPK